MDELYERIVRTLEEHERTHERVDIGRKRRELLRDCYERFKDFEGDSPTLIGVRYNKKSLEIRIVSRRIDACGEAPAFLTLVGLSDLCTIKTCRGGFMIDLEFFLWRWKKKPDCTQ